MIELVILGGALVASAWCSGTESAILSVSRVKIRHRMEAGDPRAAIVWGFLKSPEPLFTAILISNNIFNVTSAAVVTSLMLERGIDAVETWTTLAVTPVVMILGEILPKAAGRRMSESWALAGARPLDFLRLLLSPLVAVTGFLTDLMMRVAGVPDNEREQFVTREELKTFLEGVGAAEPGHKKMIRGAWTFARSSVREVMIPLTRVQALATEARIDEALERGRRYGYARFPVYRNRIDDVVGILDLGELVFRTELDPEATVASAMREPIYLPNTLSAEKAILAMQRSRETMAVILDEYGGCDGIVLMKDMFEEVVGDLEGPVGGGPEIFPVGPRLFIARGSIDIDTLNEELGLELPKQGYETLSGYLMTHLETVPRTGSKLRTHKATLEVLETRHRTASRVRIRLH